MIPSKKSGAKRPRNDESRQARKKHKKSSEKTIKETLE
jgi:hypothetical protein